MTPPFLTPHTPLSKTSLTQPLRLKPQGNACHPKLIPRADSSKATPRRKAVSLPFRDGIHRPKDSKRQVLVWFFIQELKQSRSVTPAGWTCISLLIYLSNWSLSSIKPLKNLSVWNHIGTIKFWHERKRICGKVWTFTAVASFSLNERDKLQVLTKLIEILGHKCLRSSTSLTLIQTLRNALLLWFQLFIF